MTNESLSDAKQEKVAEEMSMESVTEILNLGMTSPGRQSFLA